MNRRLWTTLLVLCWCLPLVAAQTEVLGVFPKGAAPMLYLKKANKHRLRNRRKGRE